MPEGCMVQGWSTEESIEFCTYYMGLDQIGIPVSHHEGRLIGRSTIGEKSLVLTTLLLSSKHILLF